MRPLQSEGKNSQKKRRPTSLSRESALHFARLLMRPLAAFALRHSLKIQDLIDLLKQVLVEVAGEDPEIGENLSRLSVVTGVHRKEVGKLRAGQLPALPRSLAGRVLGQWQSDKEFVGAGGAPRDLSVEEFQRLVTKVSSDVNPSAVLFDLVRAGAARQGEMGIVFVHPTYVTADSAGASFSHVSRDIDSLLRAVEENTLARPDLPLHHLRTEYDRIRADDVPKIKQWLLREGHRFHHKARGFLSQFDQDINPTLDYSGPEVAVALGSFAHIVHSPTTEEVGSDK